MPLKNTLEYVSRPITIDEIPTRFMRRYCMVLVGLVILPSIALDVVRDLREGGWPCVADDLSATGEFLAEIWRQ